MTLKLDLDPTDKGVHIDQLIANKNKIKLLNYVNQYFPMEQSRATVYARICQTD